MASLCLFFSHACKVRYSNLSTLETNSRSFTFLLTGFEQVLYGVCVHSEELHDEWPSVMSEGREVKDRDKDKTAVSCLR